MWHAPKKELGNILSLQSDTNQSSVKQTPNPKPNTERKGKIEDVEKDEGESQAHSKRIQPARPGDQKAK